MSDAVLDASALLALIFGEPGADKVADRIASCVLSTVNLSEVAAKMAERGTPPARSPCPAGRSGRAACPEAS
jgi:ribonuclease VapC